MTAIGRAPWDAREPTKGGRYDAAGNLLPPRNQAEVNRLNDAELKEASRQGWITWLHLPSRRRGPAVLGDPYSDMDAP